MSSAFDYLEFHGLHQPDAEFAACSGKRVTYGAARDAAHRIANAMLASGLSPGDRVAIVQHASLETVVLYFGAFKAGLVPTPINVRLKPSDWMTICNDTEAKLLVCDLEAASEIDPFRSQLRTVREFIVDSGSRSGWTNFDDWIAHQPADVPSFLVSEEHDALQIYTSGTTGSPKGVVVSHGGVTSCIAQLNRVLEFHPTDRFLLVMPLFHAAGIIVMLHAICGGASLLIQKNFVPADVLNALDQQTVSITMLAPTMIQKCLCEVSGTDQRKFEDLRLIIYGASPIAEETLRKAMKVFRCDFAQRYGSTETLCVSWLTPEDHRLALKERPELLLSAGHALPGVKIRVVDEVFRSVPIGERGEFVVSGPGLMRGYWHTAEETSKEVGDGRWLRTGDVGFMDSENYIYLCDRVNDVIVSGGESIYPYEVEEVLLQHPAILDAAVVGVPDAKWGEALKAIVVLRAGARLTAGQLISHCRQRLAGFMTPQSVDMVSAIPRNSGGKVLRRELREPFWEGHRRRI